MACENVYKQKQLSPEKKKKADGTSSTPLVTNSCTSQYILHASHGHNFRLPRNLLRGARGCSQSFFESGPTRGDQADQTKVNAEATKCSYLNFKTWWMVTSKLGLLA